MPPMEDCTLAFAGPTDYLIRRQSKPINVVDAEWRERVEDRADALGTHDTRSLPYSAAAAVRPIQPRNGATKAL